MSVCSGSGIVTDSTSASTESNRHSSTRVPCSEKIAKLTPTPSQVAPSGYGDPGQTRMFVVDTEGFRYHVRGRGCNQTRQCRTANCELRTANRELEQHDYSRIRRPHAHGAATVEHPPRQRLPRAGDQHDV